MPTHGASGGDRADLPSVERRFKIVGCVLLAINLCAISIGDGEFWPFSKFPMFSRAGRPWKRAFVREVSAEELRQPLVEVAERELPGKPVALHHFHINQDDISAVVRTLKQPVSEEQAALLAQYFDRLRHDRTMVLYEAYGRFRSTDRSVRVRFLPRLIIGPDGVHDVVVIDPASVGAPTRIQADGGPHDAAATLPVDAGVQ